jgi:hypothetical protein
MFSLAAPILSRSSIPPLPSPPTLQLASELENNPPIDTTGGLTFTEFGTTPLTVDTTDKVSGSGSLVFNGTDNRVIGVKSFGMAGDFEVSLSIKFNSVSGNQTLFVITRVVGTSTPSDYSVFITSFSGVLNCGVRNSSGVNNVILNAPLTFLVNTWYEIKFIVVGTNAQIIFDGIVVASGTLTDTRDQVGNNIILGAFMGPGLVRYFNGKMDNLTIRTN